MGGLIGKCGKTWLLDQAVTCNRPEGHYGVHRDKVMKDHTSRSWGETECAVIATPMGQFTVKIWYWSGAFEDIAGVDQANAIGYMAEADDNDKVCAAEIHKADGTLAVGFRHDGTKALDTADTRS